MGTGLQAVGINFLGPRSGSSPQNQSRWRHNSERRKYDSSL